jgi:hypothetical protein
MHHNGFDLLRQSFEKQDEFSFRLYGELDPSGLFDNGRNYNSPCGKIRSDALCSPHSWSIGIKLCWILNVAGQVAGWHWLPMNCPDQDFLPLISLLDEDGVVLADLGFRCKAGIPGNLKLCLKGTWNDRMMVETSFSLLTVICQAKKMFHRAAAYIEARLAYTLPCSPC